MSSPLVLPRARAVLPWLGLCLAGCGGADAGSAGSSPTVVFTAIVSIAGTLALLHLLLFAFESRDRRNLIFALLAAAFALVAFLDYRERIASPVLLPVIGPLQRWAVSALILGAARFAYSLLQDRAPRRFWVYAAAVGALLLIAIPFPGAFAMPAGLLGLLVIVDSMITVSLGHGRLRREARIVSIGAGVFALSGLVQLGLDLTGAEGLGDALAPYLWGGLVMLSMSSIYLALVFGHTRRELERRLKEVEELSSRALEQEKAAREQELSRRLLAAENERKGRELEAARNLQLAMLPQELPAVPGHELAASMITAAEVGGDYYDAALGAGGELWLAIGDAVGHGARAGSLVATAKGLFAGIAAQPSPEAALDRFGAALRRMELQRANLALTIGRLRGDVLEIAAAGMPPALVRRADGSVEEIAFSTLPLGAPLTQRYSARRVALDRGDLLVLLTDGLVELPGEDGAPIGYEAVRRLVAEAPAPGAESLASWLAQLLRLFPVDEGPPPDDVTVLALRPR